MSVVLFRRTVDDFKTAARVRGFQVTAKGPGDSCCVVRGLSRFLGCPWKGQGCGWGSKGGLHGPQGFFVSGQQDVHMLNGSCQTSPGLGSGAG